MKPKSGFYWHCHHNILCEYVWNEDERVDCIKKHKPANEIETRLRLFKKVKGKLSKELDKMGKKYDEARKKYYEARKKWDEARNKYHETWKKYDKAEKKYDEVRKKYDKAWKKYDEAGKKRDEAWKKYDEVFTKHTPELEALHKKECGCSEWNGKEIIFGDKK